MLIFSPLELGKLDTNAIVMYERMYKKYSVSERSKKLQLQSSRLRNAVSLSKPDLGHCRIGTEIAIKRTKLLQSKTNWFRFLPD